MTNAKLTTAITVKLDEETVAKLDEEMRRRERASNVPLSRAVVLRAVLRELLVDGRRREARARE